MSHSSVSSLRHPVVPTAEDRPSTGANLRRRQRTAVISALSLRSHTITLPATRKNEHAYDASASPSPAPLVERFFFLLRFFAPPPSSASLARLRFRLSIPTADKTCLHWSLRRRATLCARCVIRLQSGRPPPSSPMRAVEIESTSVRAAAGSERVRVSNR